MKRLLCLVAATLVALAAVPAAPAGGWATVSLSSTPNGLRAGQMWDLRLTVLQHGRTPLVGVVPRVQLQQGKTVRTIVARPTGKAGVYRARVVFPSAGTWRWQIDDGFSQVHRYYPVKIAAGR
jgi:hypothetical protein